MPGLDQLTKDNADARGCVFLLDERLNGSMNCSEHFRRERADVVEVCREQSDLAEKNRR